MNQLPYYMLGMGTVHMKRRRSSFRHPHTQAEIKANLEGWNRGKRSKKYLPTTWSDIPVNHDDRSWKRYRRTKYKIRDAS